MKKIIFVLLVAVFVYSCDSDETVKGVKLGKGEMVVDTFTNGSPQLIRLFEVVDGQRIPVYEKEFYEDGKILKEGPMKDNRRNGKWKAYYRDGQLWNSGSYDMGVRNDTIMGYYENGNLKYQGIFQKGVKHGVWSFYEEDGTFKESKVYLLPGEKMQDSIRVVN